MSGKGIVEEKKNIKRQESPKNVIIIVQKIAML